MRLLTSRARPKGRRSLQRTHGGRALALALFGALSVVYLLAGPRGLVLLGGLALTALLIHAWLRGRRLAQARTLERLQALSPEEFEALNERLFRRMGHRVRRVGGSGDGGIDLVADAGDGPVLVQCKRYRGTVGAPHIRDFYGALSKAQAVRGYFVTTGTFTAAAARWAEDVAIPLRLIDGVTLVGLVRTNLGPDVIPYLERTRVRVALLLAVLTITGVAMLLVPGPQP